MVLVNPDTISIVTTLESGTSSFSWSAESGGEIVAADIHGDHIIAAHLGGRVTVFKYGDRNDDLQLILYVVLTSSKPGCKKS